MMTKIPFMRDAIQAGIQLASKGRKRTFFDETFLIFSSDSGVWYVCGQLQY